jgi:hypothetical protein
MRFLPDIHYGTENYPEKVARRLRAFNLTTWCGAAIAVFGFASVVILEFLDPKPGLWKAGTRRIDLRIDPVASPLRDALGRADPYLNGACLFLPGGSQSTP